MKEIIIFIIIGCGITNILTQSYIMEWYRDLFKKNEYLSYLVKCTMCTGFWVGLIVSFIYSIPEINKLNIILSAIFHGIIISYIAYIIQSLIDSIGNISKKEETIKFNLDEAEESNE